MGHGSGHGSAPGSAHGSAQGSVPFHDDEDDSPVEEVSPVKPKKPSRRAAKAKKDEPKEVKETPKEWTVEEEIALCQGWCDVSENSISGNSMKAKGFWEAVIRYFENETGSTRGYDSIVSKWKNRVRPRIGAFCAIIKNIEANYESGTNDLDVYQKACAKYKMMYKGDFMLEHCYNILKDHPGWKNVEMPIFYQTQGRQKSKTSEITSRSASSGLNLNEEADEVVEETQEFRPMGRDRAKPKRKQPVPLMGELLHLLIWDCKMVVKEIVSRLLKEEEKLEWWFEQDIDKEEERFEGYEDGGEV
ncbi:retrotransposon protein, putative, ty3-gypsy subclass [Tanacetum coccineum]